MPPGMSPLEVRDYWSSDTRSLPIVVKEALAFVNTLQACKTLVTNARVDAHTDNMAFLQSWEKQGGKNVQLNDALKKLHQTAFDLNAVISLKYVPSSANPADPPSRVLSDLDCMLSRKAWQELEKRFGPHTIDLMSLDSNAQVDSKGDMLRHFTPFFTPHSSGVNVFAQTISAAENAFVFPLFLLVGPFLRFLLESELCFTIVVPKLYPLPFWWPTLISCSDAHLQLGSKRDLGTLSFLHGMQVCYSSTSLGPFRLQSCKWKIDIFLSFSLSSDDPEFGQQPSHVHNVLFSMMTHLTFVRDVDLEKIQLL